MNDKTAPAAPIELDFSDKLKARYSTLCDNCNAEIKSSGRCCDSTSASISWYEQGKDDSYPEYNNAQFCDVSCMKAYVAKMEEPAAE